MKRIKIFVCIIRCIQVLLFTSCEYSKNKDFSYDSDTLNITYKGIEYYYSDYDQNFNREGALVKINTLEGFPFGKFDYYECSPEFLDMLDRIEIINNTE